MGVGLVALSVEYRMIIVEARGCYHGVTRRSTAMPTTSLKLPDALKEKVSKLAPRAAQTPHAYMIEAIAEKVVRDERRREFLGAADESEAHFKRTGIAYTYEAAARYIRAIATGKPARRPKPIKVPRSKR